MGHMTKALLDEMIRDTRYHTYDGRREDDVWTK